MINESIGRLLPRLTKQFYVVHLCGLQKQPLHASYEREYRAFEYLDTLPLSYVLSAADVVISRAGATAIYELLVLHKPHILCPLSKTVSQGEQIYNAQHFEKLGLSTVIYPKSFSDETLLRTVQSCYRESSVWKQKIKRFDLQSGTQKVYETLLNFQ